MSLPLHILTNVHFVLLLNWIYLFIFLDFLNRIPQQHGYDCGIELYRTTSIRTRGYPQSNHHHRKQCSSFLGCRCQYVSPDLFHILFFLNLFYSYIYIPPFINNICTTRYMRREKENKQEGKCVWLIYKSAVASSESHSSGCLSLPLCLSASLYLVGSLACPQSPTHHLAHSVVYLCWLTRTHCLYLANSQLERSNAIPPTRITRKWSWTIKQASRRMWRSRKCWPSCEVSFLASRPTRRWPN